MTGCSHAIQLHNSFLSFVSFHNASALGALVPESDVSDACSAGNVSISYKMVDYQQVVICDCFKEIWVLLQEDKHVRKYTHFPREYM